MEDELERNMVSLFELTEKNKKEENLLYLCIFLNEGIDKYIITKNKELVNNLAKKKTNLQIYIFKNDTIDDVYNFYSKFSNNS